MEASTKFRRLSPKDRPKFQSRPVPESEFPEEPTKDIAAVESDYSEAKTEALTAPKQAATIAVIDQTSLTFANDFLQNIKQLLARIGETFDPQIAKAHDMHKSLLAEKKKFTSPLEEAEKIVKRSIAGYLAEEDRKRREAESERARIEAAARAEAERALKAAEKAESNGDTAKAEKLYAKAEAKINGVLDQAPVVPEAPKAAGLALTETWKFSIVDPGAIPREYLVPDEVKIGRIVRALKGETLIPGVRIWSERSVSARTM